MQNNNRMSQASRTVIQHSEDMAKALKDSLIKPEHILLAMVHIKGLNIGKILADKGIVFEKLEPYFEENTTASNEQQEILGLSDPTKKLLYLSVEVARDNNHSQIFPEHLLIGLMKLEDSQIQILLAQFQVEGKDIVRAVETYWDAHPERVPMVAHPLRVGTDYKREREMGFLEFLRNIFGLGKKKNDE